MNTESGDKNLQKTKDTFGFCPIYRHLTDEKGNLTYLPVLFFSFSLVLLKLQYKVCLKSE